MSGPQTNVSEAGRRSATRRMVLAGSALLASFFVLLSCTGEPTSPKQGQIRYARGLSFSPVFPASISQFSAADLVDFNRVRVTLKRTDGSIALDTTISFPAGVNEVNVDLSVPLSPGTPATGEVMALELAYLNSANETVFRGGPVDIRAIPSVAGQQPAAVRVPVVYTGSGATARTVVISPRSLAVNAGGAFSFSAVATDANGSPMPGTPILWTTLDPTRASITAPSAGVGAALNQRGTARIVAQLITGQADTVLLTVNPVATAIAAVSGSGQTGVVGKAVPRPLTQPIVVRVTAGDGLGVSGATVNFAAASGGGSVTPTSAVTDINGNAQATWTLGPNVGAQTATATVASLTGSPVTFTATGTATVATKLAFTSEPAANANIPAGGQIPLGVTVMDVDGDKVASYTGPVTIAFGANPHGATLTGSTTVDAVAGLATFTGVSISKPGAGYTLAASATGLTGASTPTFNIVTGAASSLIILSGNSQTAAASSALAPVTILVTDASGNAKPGALIDFAVTGGGGSVIPAQVVSNASGHATTTWTLGSTPGAQTMTASSIGLSPITITATATSTINHWVIAQEPSSAQVAGVALSPVVIAHLKDAANNLVTSYNGNATIAIGTNPGGATISGSTTATASGGIVTFPGISLNKMGTGYTLVVSSTTEVSATTTPFSVSAAAAAQFAIQSGNNQSSAPSAPLPQPVVVKVSDAFGNGVAGVLVTFTASTGSGSSTPPSATTDAAGLASSQWTLGASGAQSLTAASAGFTALGFQAVFGAGPLSVTTVTPQVDTLTSFTDARNFAVQGRDVGGNIVGGNWTWVSRNPAVVTVDAAGMVTSVGNGTTFVVATEAGGSKDSARVTVQQRIAGVNVTPGNRSVYTTGNFTFTALAVDGRNVAMTTQPAFTWSSTVPSVATVNATTGVATGITIGSTQVRATSGSSVGVANLTVLTPITRIDVSFDSTNAPAPDNFTMTSLGDRRMYRAVARDTLLNPMTGVAFTWSSTNASVAIIDSTTATQARATAAANGITSIQASAQGVTGSATLNVAQVLASIELMPFTATVGVTGTTPMLARGKDANARYISGGSFTYASSTPTVATIDANTGVVTGVANGSTNITATSGQITSNTAVVSVNNSGPSVITFGRDTIGVGRGGSVSVPILLSKPNASPVTVNLSVMDTIAFWGQPSVTIPAGQTSANVTLNGRNAGSSRLVAVDGGSTGYNGDTAVVAVQANLRMTSSNYSMTATDQVSTQVLLSDPSPAGGTFVTFSYSVAGRAQVSPDPAFIPAGQLAADVVIRGLTPGSTTITPSATGVTGQSANVNVSTASLILNRTTLRLGRGQYEDNNRVSTAQTRFTALTVTLTSTDTTLVTVPPTVTIPANNFQVFFNTHARGTGSALVIATAPGWAPDTFSVLVTTPKTRVIGGGTLNVTSPATTLSVYSADSSFSIHKRTSSLAVRLSSSDTTVMRVIDTLVTIAADNDAVHTGRVIPGGAGGTAYIKASAGGHTVDSVQFTVIAPKLSFSWFSRRLGAGQENNDFVSIPNTIGQSVVVTIASTDTNIVGTPPNVTIPANNSNTFWTSRAKTPGTVTLIASAPGYAPDTATIIVTTPLLFVQNGTVNGFGTSNVSVSTRDSVNTGHPRTTPLVVRLVSTDTTILKVDSTATVGAGSQSASAQVFAVSPGTVSIIATAPGHTPDTATWTVSPEKLQLLDANFNNFTTYRIGARQTRLANEFQVRTPSQRTVPVTVTLTQKQASIVSLSATSVTLPANQSFQYFTLAGLVPGRDTIIATAPGYLPDTGFVVVTTPRLDVTNLSSTMTTTDPPQAVNVSVRDSLGSGHFANDTVVVRAVSTDSNVIRPVQPFFRILKGTNFTQTTVMVTGVGTARVIYSDSANSGYRPDTTNIVTVTGPSLNVGGSNPGQIGMRQRTGAFNYYVQTPNNVAAPLTVNLISTDPRVATVPASVTIPAGQSYVYFMVTGQDTIGTIQIQATAVGYATDNVNIQVTAPKFVISTNTQANTTSGGSQFYVYAADAAGSQHEVAENVTVTLTTSAPGVATIDSATVTIPAGSSGNFAANWRPGVVGTAVLTASDSRTAFYKYLPATQSVTVVTPQTQPQFNGLRLGVGQYADVSFYIPDVARTALTVPIGHSAVPRTNTPASTTIPQGQQFGNFRVSGTSIGSDTLVMSPPGHIPGSAVVVVGLGRIDPLPGWPSSVRAGDSVQVTIVTRDQNQSARNVTAATTFTLSSNANIQFVSGGQGSAVITSVTVPADNNQVSFWVKGVSAGTGSTSITNTNYTTYTNTVTVTP